MRRLGCLVVVLAVLGGGLVAADAVLTGVAERRAAQRVGEALGAPASVDLQGWPVTLRLLLDAVPRADVVATDVPVGDATIPRLRATLNDVSATLGGDVDARGGRFAAEFDERAVERLVGLPSGVRLLGIELVDDAARLEVRGLPVVRATADVVGDDVVLRPVGPLVDRLTLTVPLDGLPPGVTVRDVAIRPGRLTVRGSLDARILDQAN